MTELIFYTNPMSRGQITRWMLEELGQPYETVLIDYAEVKSADYLAINPMGKVPAIRHGDQIVTEGAAICAYLADAFPEAGLLPRPEHRGAYYRWLFFAAGPIEAAVTNKSLGVEVTPDRARMVGYGSFGAVMDALETAVAGREFIAGDRFSAADVYVGAQIDWGLMFGSIESRPAFVEFAEKLRARDAYQRAKAIDGKLIAEAQAAKDAAGT